MLKFFFTSFHRNIRNNKFYALLNIAGLSIGITAFVFVSLYVVDEFSFDNFHKDYKRIYHVGLHLNYGGQEVITASSCPPLSEAIVTGIPGITQVVRIKPWKDVVRYEDMVFTESNAFVVDSNFFDFFGFKIIQGDAKTALTESNSVVITRDAAFKYFGNANAIGKIITIGKKNQAVKISAVAETPPSNSHIQFSFLFSSHLDRTFREGGWGDNIVFTYYRKDDHTTVSSIDSRFREIVLTHIAPQLEEGFGISYQKFEAQGGLHNFFSYPLTRSHLYYPEIQDGPSPSGDIKYLYIAASVGLFILIIACINFMNLSTARSSTRAKEVGLRKTLGSARSILIIQFLAESLVYALLATLVALLSVYLLLPQFNLLANKSITFSAVFTTELMLAIFGIFIIVGLVAGSYPAFYLTSFNPIEVLRGNLKSGVKSKAIRSTLVVVQFIISITLIICTLFIDRQLIYLQEKNIGLDKHKVLILENTRRLQTSQASFNEAVINLPNVVNASYISDVFPGENVLGVFRLPNTTRDMILPNYHVGYGLLDVLKIELATGRFFSKEFKSDSSACVINEAAMKHFGWTDPVNRTLVYYEDEEAVSLQVIGVVKDFNFESFKYQVKPLVLQLRKRSDNMLIRYSDSHTSIANSIQKVWKEYAADEPFEFSFLDQKFNHLYREEIGLGKVSAVMSGVGIFVACLGLFGLAAFTAEQRTREIGIRKVMGGSVSSINFLLTKEFMKLIVISFVLSAAISWYIMQGWLSTFAYKISLEVGVFLISGISAAAIAWITVAFHFLRAAKSNPVETLRSQ